MSPRGVVVALALAAAALATSPVDALPPAGSSPPASRGRPADPFGVAGIQMLDVDRRIDANRINMSTTNYGSFAWDIGGLGSPPGLVWPRGTVQTAVFASGLWLGCLVGTEVRTVVAEYSQEYGPGRMLGGTFDDPGHPDFKTYKVARYRGDPDDTAHVERAACYPEDPLVHHSWSEYMLGAVPYGAPWRLHRLPDTTTPAPGDSVDVAGPDILGDQMLWSVYNDADPSRHTNDAGASTPLGVEVQQSVFSFDRTDELGNVVFLRFRIENKGANTLDSLYASLWSDPDLGGAGDDLAGCDVGRALGFSYNAIADDAIYGRPAPAVGYVILRGLEHPSTGEPLGLTAFDKWINGTDPASTDETYNYMRGLLPDGSALIDPTTGLPTRYFHTGDPVTGLGWLDSGPADRRMLLTSGPSRMLPGEIQEVWAAIVVGRGADHLSSVGTVRCLADLSHTAFRQSFSPLPTPASPCSTSAVAVTASCPSPSAFWAQECALGGIGELTAQQLGQVAGFVNAQSTLFDWPVDSLGQYCAAVDTVGLDDLRQVARREFAAFLANYSGSQLDLSIGGGQRIWLNPLAEVSCPPLRARTLSELAETVSLAPGFRGASYLNDNIANRRALEGVNAGLSGFGGGAGTASEFFGSSLDPIAAPDSFVSVEVRFDHTTTQQAYRYLRLERQSDGSAPPQGRAYLYAGHLTVPFTCWDVQNNVQLDVGFVERAATDDLGTLLGPVFQPATHDSTWGPDDSGVGGREYLFVFRRPYSSTPKVALAQDGLVASGSAPALYALWSRLRTASDLIDDGDRFQFLWGRTPSPGADSLLVELEGQSLSEPAVQQAYSDLIGTLSQVNAGLGIGQTCTSGPTPTDVITATAGPNGTITPYGAIGAPTGTSRSFTIATTCPGYGVANVFVDGSPVGPVTSYTFDNVSESHTIAASFAAAGHTIMASAGPNGIIVPSGPVAVADGASQAFQFAANQRSRLVDVLVDGSPVGPVAGYTFTGVIADHTIEARFAYDPAIADTGWIFNGVPVTTATGDQDLQTVIPDGAGGVIVAWRDLRTGTADLYAQRLDAAGVPQWTAQGVAVCTAPGAQQPPRMISDGAGGAFLTWEDPRSGVPAIYAQRLSGAGSPMWAVNGVALCGLAHAQDTPVIAPNGVGGAIVAWRDFRSGTQYDLYAQRMSASGILLWGAAGVPVSTVPQHQQSPTIVSDGVGGVFLAWSDGRNDPANPDIFATRLLASGAFAPGWTALGLAISTAAFTQAIPLLVSDGVGGAIVLWLDLPSAGGGQIYAQRVSAAGVPQWGTNGINVAPGANPSSFTAVADGAGGAIAAWSDSRAGITTQDIYGQRIGPGGTPAWTPTGAPICAATGNQGTMALTPDASGGAIAVWEDARGASSDIYAQRLDLAGAPLWTTDGVPVCGFAANQGRPAIAPDGAGGGLVVWMDARDGGWDLYGQRVTTGAASGFDHAIFAAAGPNGSIAPSGPVGVHAGSAQLFDITPNPGYSVLTLVVDGTPLGPATQYTFTNLAEDHTIAAVFSSDSIGPPPSTEGAYLLASYGFDDPQGNCRPRGWTGEDRTGRVFAHASNRFLVNDGFMTMGTQALWVGADSTSALDEIVDWVQPYGFGNGWSQRLTSPAFSRVTYPRAVLRFDARIDFTGSGGLFPGVGGNDFVAVQGLKTDGTWAFLNGRRIESGSPAVTEQEVGGRGTFKYEARLGLDGNQALPLADPVRLRVVVQSDAGGSSEDGLVPPGTGAAVIDNVTLRDSVVNIVAPVDFEGGGAGVWALSAMNGAYGEGAPAVIRDVPSPGTLVQLRTGFDEAVPSCAWTFTSAGDSLPSGVHARLVSPWFALADPDSQVLITFAGKLNTIDQGRVLNVIVRGKRTGDSRPRHASRHLAMLNSGASGGDEASPFFPEHVLQYPQNFLLPQRDDSIQVVFQVEDRGETFGGLTGRPRTRLPFLDDIRIYQILSDSDGDGVANVIDDCPAVNASGQDADGDGCVDSTATLRHVESWSRASPEITYAITQDGDPSIGDGTDLAAVRAGFDAWVLTPGADVPVVEDALTPQSEAAALDGVNLVTFTDADFGFPPNVLAVTPTTSFIRRAAFNDRIVLPGEIVDADLMFNPASTFSTPTRTGDHDLRSVATHEIGHLLGLSHSGVLDATMFFVLQQGAGAATLTADDISAIRAAYPDSNLWAGFATVSGAVHRGRDGLPLPGALVTAVRLNGGGAPLDSAGSDYSNEEGRYALRGLQPGNYSVRVTPLDGNVGGFPLTPAHVSARLAAIAQTDFEAEWWSDPESDRDDPTLRGVIALAAGAVRNGIDITTNVDTMPPSVAAVLPADSTTGIPIDSPILVRFSEPVIPAALKEAFRLEREDPPGSVGGGGQLIGGREFVFAPTGALEFGHVYRIRLSTELTDRSGLPLATEFVSTFTTQNRPTVAITGIHPDAAPLGSIVTITGVGFDPAPGAVNKVLFSVDGVQDSLDASNVTPTSLVVTVPGNAVTGPVVVVVAGPETSNPRAFTVLPPGPLLAPIAGITPARLGFAPTDVVLSPDGLTALVVGDGGFASVDLTVTTLPITTHSTVPARSIALTPDGARAVITRPARGEVVVVVATRGSGTFGQPLATLALSGAPGGVVVAPDGTRAFVTDAPGGMVHVLDIDPTSVALYSERHQIPLPATALTGGVAVDPRGGTLVLTSSDRGLLAVDLSTDAVVVLNPTPNSGGVAIPPSGAEVLAPGGTLVSSLITASLPDAVSVPGQVILGGAPRDVAVHPQGRSALVVNSLFDELQVVDIDTNSSTYHQAVARVGTGRSPIAIAVSAAGGVVAVANYGDRSISIYATQGADASLLRVIPDVASPGDLVGVETANDAYDGGTQADLGDGLFPASNATAEGVGLRVPVSPASQRTTSLTLQDAVGTRSLALPFRVVDRIEGHAPKLPPLSSTAAPADCAQSPGAAAANSVLRISTDGRVLAVARDYDTCPSLVRFYRVSAEGPEVFGGFLAQTPIGEGEDILDLTFSSDSRLLYVMALGSGLHVIDSDPASPGFGAELPPPAVPSTTSPTAVARDPLGRFLIVGRYPEGQVPMITCFTPDGSLVDTVQTPSAATCMSGTGDGRYLVAGMDGQAVVIDLSLRTVIATTPLHAGAGSLLSVAVVGNGSRAVGLFPNSTIAVWNLDPLAGPIGAELYFGNPFPSGPVSQLVPAPDGDGVLAGCSNCGLLFKVEPSLVPPGIQSASLGQTSARIARSPDGRQLWVAERDTSASMGGPRMFSLSEATAMDLVSGASQTGRPGEPLPRPMQVRLSGPDGRPQAGVVVAFVLQGADPGTLDGLPVTSVRRITDVDGQAKVGWTLGGTLGTAALQILAQGVPDSVSVAATVVGSDAEIVPQVIQLGPADGATQVNAGTALFARFNQPMDPASVVARMRVLAPSGPVSGTLSFEEDGRMAIFRPLRALPFSTACSLEVVAGALDLDDQATTDDVLAKFTTEPPPPVQLTAIGPPAAAEGATVVLEGEGFSPVASQNLVLFNGRLAPVTRATSTSIVTSVPKSVTSGPVKVILGAATSNEIDFEVLVPTATPGESLGTIPADKAVSDVAITPDGTRAYVTSPATNGVTVLDIQATARLTSITVGLEPQGIAILPDGTRAYVANSGSNDLSVIDTDPASPNYNTVIDRVPVGEGPVDVVTSPVGPSVYVANSRSGTVSMVDANTNNGTYNQVVKTVNAGSGASSISIAPDGARIYVGVSAGVVMVDLASQVVTTVNAGSGCSSISITPDGTLVLALLDDGQLIVVDATPTSATFNRVVTTVNAGSGASSISISPDATLAYVTSADGNVVLVYQIVKLNSGAPVATLPGPSVTLTLVATIPVGDGPADIALDPAHNLFALVANEGSGTITVIGFPTSLPPVPVGFAFSPGSLSLGSGGKWVTGYIEPPAPFLSADIVVSSVRLNGVVVPDAAGPQSIGDYDDDGLPDLMLKFDRAAVQLILPAGAQVPVRVEGTIGTRTFLGQDIIKVKVGKVSHPQAGETVNLLEPYTVRWVMPDDLQLSRVAIVHSLDHGATWTLDASRLPNTGSAEWSPPAVVADSVLVAVVDVRTTANDTLVTAVVGVSGFFRLTTPTAAEAPPARLEFSPIRPNPSMGLARLRFGLPQPGRVDLALFDIQGRRLAVLVAGEREAGWHEVHWDGRTEAGGTAGAGLYFARLRAGGREFRQRLIWIR